MRWHSRVDKARADSESFTHPLHRQRLIRLQDLRIRLDAHLTDVVSRMRREDRVGHQVLFFDLREGGEQFGVVGVVKGFYQGCKDGHLRHQGVDFGASEDLNEGGLAIENVLQC